MDILAIISLKRFLWLPFLWSSGMPIIQTFCLIVSYISQSLSSFSSFLNLSFLWSFFPFFIPFLTSFLPFLFFHLIGIYQMTCLQVQKFFFFSFN
jgi:hypothetical protein